MDDHDNKYTIYSKVIKYHECDRVLIGINDEKSGSFNAFTVTGFQELLNQNEILFKIVENHAAKSNQTIDICYIIQKNLQNCKIVVVYHLQNQFKCKLFIEIMNNVSIKSLLINNNTIFSILQLIITKTYTSITEFNNNQFILTNIENSNENKRKTQIIDILNNLLLLFIIYLFIYYCYYFMKQFIKCINTNQTQFELMKHLNISKFFVFV